MVIVLILTSIATGLLAVIAAGLTLTIGLLDLLLAYWLGGMAGAVAILVLLLARDILQPPGIAQTADWTDRGPRTPCNPHGG